MTKYRFDQIARECRETYSGNYKDIPIVGLEHIIPNEMLLSDCDKNVETTFTKSFKKGQILFGRRRAYQRKACVATFDGICSGDITVIEAVEGIVSAKLLPFIIQSDDFFEHAIKGSNGALSPRVKWEHMSNFEIELPSISEQELLADKLWAAYELKRSYQDMIKATDEMVKSQFIEMFGDDNWPQKCLGEVGSFKRGGGFQKSDYVEHGIPCIHYGQIHTKFGPFITCHITEISSDLEPKMKYASKGDLIIAITSEDVEGSCKCTAWLGDYPVAVGGHAAIYSHSMNPLYMSFFFRSVLFNHAKNEYVHGTKVFEIKPDDIAKISVPYPPMSMQEEFSVIAQQADKSKFMRSKSQFIEMFDSMDTTPVGEYVLDSFPGEWGIEDTNGTGVKVIRTTNFTNSGKLNLTDVIKREIEMKKVNRKRIMKYDTILERSGGTADNPVGRVVLFEEDDLYLCNNFTQVLRFKDIDPRFAFYSLFYFYQTNKTAIRGMGNKTTGIQNLNMSKYLGIGIPNASVEQQKTFTTIAEQADKSKLICLLWKHSHCRNVYTK